MSRFALDKDGKLICIPWDTGTERVLPESMTSSIDKEQLDILDKIKKLIKENEKLKVNNDKLKKQNRLLKQEVIMSKCRGDITPLNGMVITVLKDDTHCNELPKGTLALALPLDYLENKEDK